MKYNKLFEPMNIGKCEIKNRIVMAPMLVGLGTIDGTVTEKQLDYYEERAKGGTGLIITEITRVNDVTGAAAFAQMAASHDYHIEGMRKLADRIHKHDAKIFVQLHHPGRQNIGLLVGTVPACIALEKAYKGFPDLLYKITPTVGKIMIDNNIVPPSVCPSKVEPSYFAGGFVRGLTKKEIKKLIQNFIDAAVRVKKSGCDGVQLHASHGYLLQQFLSPYTNRRTDEYGGSLENRMRFILEIIAGIKEKCGKDFPVIVRLTVDECYEKIGYPDRGYKLEDGVKMAKILEKAGIDAIDVSSASYDTFNYWLEPISFEPGWRKYMAKAIKENVNIPVIAANLIRSPKQAEEQLEEGVQDFISLGRPHIAEPHWANKAKEGREKEIKRCICCLNCIESMQNNAYIGSHGECAVNPSVGREKRELKENGDGRKVVIIGGGVAGLTCAEILGKRGFKPIIIEKEKKLGGQINLANKPPKKEKINWVTEDLTYAAKKAGAEFIYGVEANPTYVRSLDPYAVVIATGAAPISPKFSGDYDSDKVCTVDKILAGKVKPKNKNICVIGSGMTGLETAEMLAEKENRVTVVEMASSVAPGTWMQHIDDIMPKLEDKGVRIMTSEKLTAIYNDHIETENTSTGTVTEIPCDLTVLSLGVRSVRKDVDVYKNYGYKTYVIGDALKTGRIATATASAYNLAMNLD